LDNQDATKRLAALKTKALCGIVSVTV
jgi:hypothetical protein